MTTKTLSGTYSAGYLVSSKYSTVSITHAGRVGGFGLITQVATTVDNAGLIAASHGAAGLYMQSGGGIYDKTGGLIFGGTGDNASKPGASGQAGGAGVVSIASTYLLNNGGVVGGYGGGGSAGGAGGAGGAGVPARGSAR